MPPPPLAEDDPELLRELRAAFALERREHLTAIHTALQHEASPQALREMFRRAHSLKGAARAVDRLDLETRAHALETLLTEALQAGAMSAQTRDAVQEALDGLEDPPDAGAAARPPARADTQAAADGGPAPDEGGHLPIAAAQIEDVAAAARALALAMQALDPDDPAREAATALRRLAREAVMPEAARAALGALAATFARQARARGEQLHAVRRAARRADVAASRLALVRAETVFGALGGMARSLAREAGIAMEIVLSGLDLMADRQMLQALRDPAMHLLRNVLGHAPEPMAARRQAGKPEALHVVLSLAVERECLVLRVADDGPGPDLARIEAVAIARGLLPSRPPGAPPPAPERLLALVFEPGFSTASAADALSGRGMGLSVVMQAARRLHGGAMLRPRVPHGAEIAVSVPLSAARRTLLVVEASGYWFGLPGEGVERILRIPVEALALLDGERVLRVGKDAHGDAARQDVPLVALAGLVGLPQAPLPVEDGHVRAVVLRHGGLLCAAAVDTLHEVREMLVSAPDAAGLDEDVVSGLALRDSDTPVLVLSADGLVARWLERKRRGIAGMQPAPPAAPRAAALVTPRTVLVVDDSITTRTLQKSILEQHGYQVVLSVDGLDALATLRAGDHLVDLVVADVEMPRMDGFGLVQAIRTDPLLAPLPVVLMTSRDAPQDRERGLSLGASAYMTKQKFDQRALVATIEDLL